MTRGSATPFAGPRERSREATGCRSTGSHLCDRVIVKFGSI